MNHQASQWRYILTTAHVVFFFHRVSLSVPWKAPGENGELESVLYRRKKSPPAASKMRDGGTSHKLTALKSVSLQGTVCPCMQQIGLIILQLCDKGKVASDATRTPFFLLHEVWLHTSQQWLTILKPTNTLYGFLRGILSKRMPSLTEKKSKQVGPNDKLTDRFLYLSVVISRLTKYVFIR